MKIKKYTLTILTMIVLMATCIILKPDCTQAAGKKTKAMKAYKEFLAKDTIKWDADKCDASVLEFMITDIDGDKVPELIINNMYSYGSGVVQKVYTYKNKKVKHMLDSTNECFKIYPKKHTVKTTRIVSTYGNTNWYKISKGKAKHIASNFCDFRTETEECKINGKKVSLKKFNKYIERVTTKKELKMKFYENSEDNRNKILK